jgi:hypothetical protein
MGQVGEAAGEALATALVMAMDVDREPLAEHAAEPIELGGCVGTGEWAVESPRETEEPAGMLVELRPRRERLTLGAPARRVGEQPAEITIAGARFDQQVEPPRTLERHVGADDRPHAGTPRGLKEARRAVDAVSIGERQRVVAAGGGALDQIFGKRCAMEKAEGAATAQLDVGRRRHDGLDEATDWMFVFYSPRDDAVKSSASRGRSAGFTRW